MNYIGNQDLSRESETTHHGVILGMERHHHEYSLLNIICLLISGMANEATAHPNIVITLNVGNLPTGQPLVLTNNILVIQGHLGWQERLGPICNYSPRRIAIRVFFPQ